VGEGVELGRGDTGCHGVAQDLERASDDQSRLAHDGDLVGCLDLDTRAEEAHRA
jgi:hypothetical protein